MRLAWLDSLARWLKLVALLKLSRFMRLMELMML